MDSRRIKPHKSLKAWQQSVRLVKDIYKLTSQFPSEEKFSIVSQLRRAVVSVPVNIAEGAARSSKKEFIKFLYISSASLSEIDTLFEILREINFIENDIFEEYQEKIVKIDILIDGLIKKIKKEIA